MPANRHAVARPVPVPSSSKRPCGFDAARAFNSAPVRISDGMSKPSSAVRFSISLHTFGTASVPLSSSITYPLSANSLFADSKRSSRSWPRPNRRLGSGPARHQTTRCETFIEAPWGQIVWHDLLLPVPAYAETLPQPRFFREHGHRACWWQMICPVSLAHHVSGNSEVHWRALMRRTAAPQGVRVIKSRRAFERYGDDQCQRVVQTCRQRMKWHQ